MKHVATIMIAAALAVVVSGPADAWKKDWNKFWKQATDKKCWSNLGKNNDYENRNCKM